MSFPRFKLPVTPPLPPMEAQPVRALPRGRQWQLEPQWDGFRCLVFRDGHTIALQSKTERPLDRYFPELVAALHGLPAERFVLDGAIVIPAGRGFDAEALRMRLHPAERRVRKLAAERPARLMVFDLLVDAQGNSWLDRPLVERRAELERFAARCFDRHGAVQLSPTLDVDGLERWTRRGPAAGGVVAKRLDQPYRSGERAMQKWTWAREAEPAASDPPAGRARRRPKGGDSVSS
jgi:ATP-dependent DNA ligase